MKSNCNPTKADVISENTLRSKLGLWARNVRDNLPVIYSTGDAMDLPKVNGPVLCLAAGDSLYLHMDEIDQFVGTTLSCERNLVPLLENGIVPDYVLSIDGSDLLTKYIDHPLVDQYAEQMTGVFATTAAPSLVARWPGEMYFFNPWIDNIREMKSVSLIFQEITKKSVMHTGGNCGTTLWFFAQLLKADPVVMLGVDLAYPASTPDLSYTQIWDMVKELPEKEILALYRRETNPFGNEIITDYAFDALKETWVTWIKGMESSHTIQCSDYSIVHEDPIKCMVFKDYLQN